MKAFTRFATVATMTAVLLVSTGFTTVAESNSGATVTVQASGGRLG